jgi:hypothetical protein
VQLRGKPRWTPLRSHVEPLVSARRQVLHLLRLMRRADGNNKEKIKQTDSSMMAAFAL